MDPIAKFSYITDEKNMFYGVSLRKSGKFDVYWNMTLVDSPQKGIIFLHVLFISRLCCRC